MSVAAQNAAASSCRATTLNSGFLNRKSEVRLLSGPPKIIADCDLTAFLRWNCPTFKSELEPHGLVAVRKCLRTAQVNGFKCLPGAVACSEGLVHHKCVDIPVSWMSERGWQTPNDVEP
jgi:hypothetical protein